MSLKTVQMSHLFVRQVWTLIVRGMIVRNLIWATCTAYYYDEDQQIKRQKSVPSAGVRVTAVRTPARKPRPRPRRVHLAAWKEASLEVVGALLAVRPVVAQQIKLTQRKKVCISGCGEAPP